MIYGYRETLISCRHKLGVGGQKRTRLQGMDRDPLIPEGDIPAADSDYIRHAASSPRVCE